MSTETGGAAVPLLKETERAQLESYVQWAANDGAYYGDKRHFDKRHARIAAWVVALPTVESERAKRAGCGA